MKIELENSGAITIINAVFYDFTLLNNPLKFLCTPFRWLHLECERQNSGQVENPTREDYVCSTCRSPAAEQAEDMDTGAELIPLPASMRTDSKTGSHLAKKHTDLEPGTLLPPEMHNDPKPELLAVHLLSDPEHLQDAVQQEKPASTVLKSGESFFYKLVSDSEG